jgi:type IV pilus assembly protein PilQ
MRNQVFKNSPCLRRILFLLALTSGPIVNAYSSALLSDSNLEPSLSKVVDHKEEKPPTSMEFSQNHRESLSHQVLGEIIVVNTKEEEQTSLVSIESTQPVRYTAFKLLNPLRLILDFSKMDQGSLTSSIKVDKGVVNSIRPIYFREVGILRIEIILNKPANYKIKKKGKNKLIVYFEPSELVYDKELVKSIKETTTSNERAAGNVTESIAGKINRDPKDTCYPMLYGEKETISLDFQNADIRNLFRIFAEISGFNVILSPEVKGSVSTRMMDVAWNDAMEIILTNSGLGRECFGSNIVRVVTKTVLESEEEARSAEKTRVLAEKVNEKNAQDLVTEVVHIDNANIRELAISLATLKSARLDARITVDTRTNTLILSDLRQHVDEMLETIKILDVPTAQVLIEAKFVEINKSFAEDLGVQWGLTGELDIKNTNKEAISASLNSSSGVNFLVNLAHATNQDVGNIPGFGMSMGDLLPGLDLNMRLQALEAQGKGRVLSSPKVTTADNKEARIRSGRQIPYQVTSNEGNSIQFVNAELSLKVVPHITSDNKVYMIIDATKNTADFKQLVGTTPTVTTKVTHTEVLVGNGDTTVLGGIYERTSTENKKGVPFLSKIPLLGLLFTSYTDSDTITELLVFITPTIIEPD